MKAGEAPTARLRLFDTPAEASGAIARSTGGHTVVAVPLGGKLYLKRLGLPNIEPRYLCSDSRWRKWDNVAELAAIG